MLKVLEQDLVSQKTSSSVRTANGQGPDDGGTFRGELTRWLATAQDAATANPPHGRVVIERLEQALRKIEGEVQWLDNLRFRLRYYEQLGLVRSGGSGGRTTRLSAA